MKILKFYLVTHILTNEINTENIKNSHANVSLRPIKSITRMVMHKPFLQLKFIILNY